MTQIITVVPPEPPANTCYYECKLEDFYIKWKAALLAAIQQHEGELDALPFSVTSVCVNPLVWKAVILTKSYRGVPCLRDKDQSAKDFLTKCSIKKFTATTEKVVFLQELQNFIRYFSK